MRTRVRAGRCTGWVRNIGANPSACVSSPQPRGEQVFLHFGPLGRAAGPGPTKAERPVNLPIGRRFSPPPPSGIAEMRERGRRVSDGWPPKVQCISRHCLRRPRPPTSWEQHCFHRHHGRGHPSPLLQDAFAMKKRGWGANEGHNVNLIAT